MFSDFAGFVRVFDELEAESEEVEEEARDEEEDEREGEVLLGQDSAQSSQWRNR